MNNYPLIKYVVVFICGIILQSILGIALINSIVVLFFAVLIFVILHFKKFENLSKLKLILSLLLVLIYGTIHYSVFKNEKVIYPFESPLNKNAIAYGKVTFIDLIRKDRIIFYIETDSVIINENIQQQKIKLICTVKDSKRRLDDYYSSMIIGSKLKIKGTIARARDRRNPGEFDYESYIAEKGIHGLMIVYKVSDLERVTNEIDMVQQSIFNIRKSIDASINKLHNKSTTALIRGLILADRGMIDYEIKNEFINAGVIHVLAVSGLHVGFVALIFVFLFKRFNPYLRYGFTILGLILFLVITNSPTSVVRATIMAIVMIISPLSGRNYNSINAIALAALIILLFAPGELFNPGFQLSFSAVLSIVVLYPSFSKSIFDSKIKSNFIKYILLFCSVSIAAQIGTLPFTLAYFHKLSVIALLANIIVIPLVGFVVGLSIITILISPVVAFLGTTFASSNEFISYVLFNVVRILGNPDFSFISVKQFSVFDSILFYLAISFLFYYWDKISRFVVKLLFVGLLFLTLLLGFRLDEKELMQSGKLSMMMIDIGQGDAILLKFPNGETALVDAGDATQFFDNGERIIIPLLDYLGIDKIDYGFISHIDADHYRGYFTLIKNQRIKKIYKPKIDSSQTKDIELENFIRDRNIPIQYFGKSKMKIGNAQIYVLNDTLLHNYKSFSTNDKSGFLKIIYGNTSFLLTGDAGDKSEYMYIKDYGNFLKSNVLKVGHHGSKTSTNEKFLNIVDPDYALISAGILNKFKHPHKEVLDLFLENRVEVFRTDKIGAVLIQSDGREVKNINWKKEEFGSIL